MPLQLSPTQSQQPSHEWVSNPDSSACAVRSRTLVLCFDGTGDQFDRENSNVIKFFSALKKDDQKLQMVYYQSGIGTYVQSTFVTPVMTQVAKTLDKMFAWNLASHVMDGYEFLMQNYSPGDKISIFGFSRGAYTARALAGMVQKVGLLPACNAQQLPFAWAMYARDDMHGCIDSVEFKKTFSIDVKIDFVGVWDTVASVGVRDVELPFVADNHAIRTFRHALALDEHRVMFLPNFYYTVDGRLASSPTQNNPRPASGESTKSKDPDAHSQLKGSELWQSEINAETGVQTDAKEVWFAGCHCDVGGSSVPNATRHSLARIPLRWMIRECFRAHTGIIFDGSKLRDFGLEPTTVMQERPQRRSASNSDANQVMYLMEPVDELEAQEKILAFKIVKFAGGVVMIPIKALWWFAGPAKHLSLLVYDSPPLKQLRQRIRFKKTRLRKWLGGKSAGGREKLRMDADATIPRTEREDNSSSMKASGYLDEEEEELYDALSPEYDQLAITRLWWILESVPMRHRVQEGSRDDAFVRCNWGKGREIYGDAMKGGLFVHRSVKTRLEARSKGKEGYKPRAWFKLPGSDRKEPDNWDVEHGLWQWVD